jgi:hypothetical protein
LNPDLTKLVARRRSQSSAGSGQIYKSIVELNSRFAKNNINFRHAEISTKNNFSQGIIFGRMSNEASFGIFMKYFSCPNAN